MKEFIVVPPGAEPIPELFELEDAVMELGKHMCISHLCLHQAIKQYQAGQQYEFRFVDGSKNGLITAYGGARV